MQHAFIDWMMDEWGKIPWG